MRSFLNESKLIESVKNEIEMYWFISRTNYN